MFEQVIASLIATERMQRQFAAAEQGRRVPRRASQPQPQPQPRPASLRRAAVRALRTVADRLEPSAAS